MLSVLGFLIILGPLVIVHEFGHFTFAKIFGVKAETFSVGFGPKLWSKMWKGTEWKISAIPLGGYVKLLGEDQSAKLSPEEQACALHRAKPWKRFFIFFGGPLFNFIFAAIIFMVIMAVGEPQPASYVGRVVEFSRAAQAGFQSGDHILEIAGKPVKFFEDVVNEVSENPGKTLDFLVMHPGAATSTHLQAVPTDEDGFSIYGESTRVGDIEGMLPAGRSGQVGVADPHSIAGKAGIKTGDQLVSMDGRALNNWEIFLDQYKALSPGAAVRLEFSHPKMGANTTVTFNKPSPGSTPEKDWGLYASELFVDKTVAASPAELAGVKSGDRLVGVDGQEVHSFFELREAVQKAGEKEAKISLKWEHEGQLLTQAIAPTATAGRDPLLKKTTQYTVGVLPLFSMADPVNALDRTLNPFVLIYKGFERMVIFTYRNLVSIGKMFVGDVSVKSLGGPIMIGKIAGESLAHGLVSFLTTMAILSIGLGVLNVLPVPVLDGGHLLLLVVETIRRKPLTLRQMEIVQGVGLSLILLLMAVVMKNDIMRLPFFY